MKHLEQLVGERITLPTGADREIHGICLDSRQVGPGTLFIALPGVRSDGADYVQDALHRGAAAVIVEGSEARVEFNRAGNSPPVIYASSVRVWAGEIADRFFDRPTAALAMAGVTGTNGKTSVTQYIAQLLTGLGKPCGVLGTTGYGFLEAMHPATHTTPDVIRVHRELAALRDQGAEAVAMEVSSHGLEQERVAGVRFQVGVLTNLTRDHLDYHGDMAAYAEAKRKLFERPELSHCIVNLDDGLGRELAGSIAGARCITYSLYDSQADWHARDVKFTATGIDATLESPSGAFNISVPLLGEFNLANLMAAMAVVSVFRPEGDLSAACGKIKPVAGRMETLARGSAGVPGIVLDYAHTPDALENALVAMGRHRKGHLWCLFGCGGDRDRGKRPEMGRIAQCYADRVIVTDDNPRTEASGAIIEDILQGMDRSESLHIIADREKAIKYAIEHAGLDDLILIAGKGHEDYQEINGKRFPFSDSRIAATALQQRSGS